MKNNLKHLRVSAGFTLKSLGDLCGWHSQQIAQLERSDTPNPTLSTAYVLATALGVDVTDIWPNDMKVGEETITVQRVTRGSK